jgi:hypothetical protein
MMSDVPSAHNGCGWNRFAWATVTVHHRFRQAGRVQSCTGCILCQGNSVTLLLSTYQGHQLSGLGKFYQQVTIKSPRGDCRALQPIRG